MKALKSSTDAVHKVAIIKFWIYYYDNYLFRQLSVLFWWRCSSPLYSSFHYHLFYTIQIICIILLSINLSWKTELKKCKWNCTVKKLKWLKHNIWLSRHVQPYLWPLSQYLKAHLPHPIINKHKQTADIIQKNMQRNVNCRSNPLLIPKLKQKHSAVDSFKGTETSLHFVHFLSLFFVVSWHEPMIQITCGPHCGRLDTFPCRIPWTFQLNVHERTNFDNLRPRDSFYCIQQTFSGNGQVSFISM